MRKKLSNLILPLAAVAGFLALVLPRLLDAGPDPVEFAKAILLAGAWIIATFFAWSLCRFRVREILEGVRRFAKKGRRTTALLFGAIASLTLIVLIEAVFLVINKSRVNSTATTTSVKPKDCAPDDYLGYRLIPNSTATAKKTRTHDGQVLYSVRYTTDTEGRRTNKASPATSDKTVAFFGGSFIFGEGVNDEATLPHLFAEAAPGHKALNYGCHGYGSAQVLGLIEKDGAKIAKEARAKSALIGVYGFIDDHIGRTVGSMRHVNWFCAKHPYYEVNGDSIEHRGNFLTSRPTRSVIYWLLGKSQTLKFLDFNWPLSDSRSAIETTARVIAKARDVFESKTGSDKFVVFLYPGVIHGTALIEHLDTFGVKYLDYSKLIDIKAPGMAIENDGHPTPKANKILAQRLAEDLAVYLR